MIKNKINMMFFLAASLIIFSFFYKNNNKIETSSNYPPVMKNSHAARDNSKQLQETKQGPPVTTKTNLITKSEIKSFNESLPSEDKVIEDKKQNPHSPSTTLMSFAQRMGPLMEKAFQNEKDAGLMVKELTDCASEESIAVAARATCVTNAEKLGKAFPEFEKAATDLRSSVSPDVQKILDTNDAIIRK